MAFNGYIPEREDRGLLRSLSIGSEWQNVVGATAEPKEYDPEKWFTIRQQGGVGSCRGHSGAAVGEALAFNQAGELDLDKDGTKFEPLSDRFSPAFMYYVTQKHDGIRGDSGSTMSGGIKTVTQDGLCPEEFHKYTARYSPRVPDIARTEAAKFKVQKTWVAEHPEDEQGIWEWVQAGVGWFDMGTVWPLPFSSVEGLEYVYDGRPLRSRGGGHATAGIGCINRGNTWFYKIANSHGKQAQNNGWYYVTRRGMAALLSHGHTVIPCYSDLANIRRRPFDWATGELFL